ncbi:N-acetylmuramoyl-L-alanine amidase [Thalassobacillus pellis]|uniref:N-acetylmuramoyl-L-alanine amidase n=1 Tax=Thalassobacillus pellis TaxID=748008 RepID=UPI0019614374|nr:N-acetylmuramoyl-L-alanine amidase [Thalassobacillus pellis]MBM7551687.1 N-acetylmuramoyl-L-alanine amidase [Thalassobacillus pellis]
MIKRNTQLLFALFALVFMSNVFVGKAEAGSLKDIPDKYAEEINYLINKSVVTGYPNGYFYPEKSVTREEAATMIGRALNLNGTERNTSFNDVDSSSYASGYIQSAVEKGIITGYGDGTFKPKNHITRGEMAFLISRAFNLTQISDIHYYDVERSGKRYEAINKVSTAGIAMGYPDGSYRPDQSITRAEFSLLVARGLNPDFKVEVQPQPIDSSVVSTAVLNVRTGPGISYDRIGQLTGGSIISIYKVVGNWAYMSYNDLKGYVHTDYLRENVRIVAIDAGHGDHDPGAQANGLVEKEINLDVALRTQRYLEKAGIKVVMTRTDDSFLKLNERIDYAVNRNADTFVSIHSNAFTPNAHGTETYYSTADLNPRAEASKMLATFIQERLVDALNTYDRGVKEGPFRVIEHNPLPSVLLELGFVTNDSDAAKLGSSFYRERAAKAIYLGIEDYYDWKY